MASASKSLEAGVSHNSMSAKLSAIPSTLLGNAPQTANNLTCAVCSSIFHNAISITPCLHTFCAGCIYQWYAQKQNCPNCRAPITDLIPNRFIRDCVDNHLKVNKNDERCHSQTDSLDEAELAHLEKWLIQYDPSFLSAMQMSTSGHMCQMRIDESKTYYDSLYNEKKRRMDQLRLERHHRQGNQQIEMMPIDEYLEEKKKSADANETKERIKISMRVVLSQMSEEPNNQHDPSRARRENNRLTLELDEMIFLQMMDNSTFGGVTYEMTMTEMMRIEDEMIARTAARRRALARNNEPTNGRRIPRVQTATERGRAAPLRRSRRIANRNGDNDIMDITDSVN